MFQTCKLAACLYVLVSLADAIANISLTTGISECIPSTSMWYTLVHTILISCIYTGKFSSLNEKYEELIGSECMLPVGPSENAVHTYMYVMCMH